MNKRQRNDVVTAGRHRPPLTGVPQQEHAGPAPLTLMFLGLGSADLLCSFGPLDQANNSFEPLVSFFQ